MIRSKTQEIDKRLVSEYDNPISRKDYYTFFEWFDRKIIMDETGVEFLVNNARERSKWPFLSINKKRKREFDIIVEALVKYNIIWRSQYQFGPIKQYCRTYRYAEDFLDSFDIEDVDVQVPTEKKIKDKIYYFLPNHKQYKLLSSQRFSIDNKAATGWVLDAYKENRITKRKATLFLDMVNNINNKNLYLSIGEKNNRVTSSFTNLKSDLRNFCKIDNIHLESIDMKSAHAYFLIRRLIKINSDPNSDVYKLYDIITKDDLYYYLLKDLGLELTEQNRNIIKKDFFHFVYKGSAGKPVASQKIIMKKFPDTWNLLKQYNKLLNENGESLAVILQKEETSIFIPIANRYVDRGCLSVHDSLYYKPSLRGEIEQDLSTFLDSNGYTDYRLKISSTQQ